MSLISTIINRICTSIVLGLVFANVSYAGEQTGQAVDELDWMQGPPGINYALLWGDWSNDTEYGMIVKIKAGYTLPWHAHTYNYRGVTVRGTWVHIYNDKSEKSLEPGGYAFQRGMEFHGDRCEGDQDCMIMIYMKGNRDFLLPEE